MTTLGRDILNNSYRTWMERTVRRIVATRDAYAPAASVDEGEDLMLADGAAANRLLDDIAAADVAPVGLRVIPVIPDGDGAGTGEAEDREYGREWDGCSGE